jgi:hypothetical protein
MLIQPFVNYNFPDGWYLTSSPVITADWLADGRKWIVPVGGGFGRLFKLGEQPINTQVQVFYNANDAARRGEMAGAPPDAIAVSEIGKCRGFALTSPRRCRKRRSPVRRSATLS